MMAYWTIRARLLRVPGVANVAIWGEQLQMLTVQVDPDKMATRDVALDDVMEVTANSLDSGLLRFSNGAVIGTGGLIQTAEPAVGVQHVLPDRHARPTWPRSRWRTGPARRCALGDVADRQRGSPAADRRRRHQRRAGPAPRRGEAALGEHARASRMGVEAGASRACSPACPASSSTPRSSGRPGSSRPSIHNLTQALLLGCLLVVLILGLFLFEWRVAVISVLTIPLSLMATMLVLYWRGATINTMIAGRAGDRPRGGRRRRHHRRREHRPPAAPAPPRGQHRGPPPR